MAKSLYEIGEIPPVGEVPAQMHAQLIRPDRFGEPEKAFQDEVIDVPEVGPQEALVLVMAAGVNFNNVWAARGIPVDVTKTQARWGEPTDFHIGGSDASGVVYKVGEGVTNAQVAEPWVTLRPVKLTPEGRLAWKVTLRAVDPPGGGRLLVIVAL